MIECPYCQATGLTDITASAEKRRPDLVAVLMCGACSGHSVKHRNGRVYPLVDRANKDSDGIRRGAA